MGDPDVVEQFEKLLDALKAQKSMERTERDRYVAITITEVEKALAVYVTYCEKK